MVSNWNCQMLRGLGVRGGGGGRFTTSAFVQIVVVLFAHLVKSTRQVSGWTEQSENLLHGIK